MLSLKQTPVVSPQSLSVPPVKLPSHLHHCYGKIFGTPANGDRASVDTPMAVAQRDYREEDVIKYIGLSKGLDWNLFGHVTVVQRADGSRVMINGQHRTGLVKTIDPSITEVPAHIIYSDDEQYISKLFGLMNGVASRNVTAEQLLWAQVLALDSDALRVQRMLILCDVACGKVNEGVSIITGEERRKVKRANFEKCLHWGERETTIAVELCKKAFPNNEFNNLLSGLVRLLTIKEYKSFSNNNLEVGRRFETWFTTELCKRSYKKATYPDLRTTTWYNAIAWGLYSDFRDWMKYNNWICPSGAGINNIIKKDDNKLLED
jgi:hypothetical protein